MQEEACEALDFTAGKHVDDRLPLLVGKGAPSRNLIQRPKTADTKPALRSDATGLDARAGYGLGLAYGNRNRRQTGRA